MDLNGSGEESDSLVDSRRQDMEELISLLDNYKLEIENKCEAKSVAPLESVDSEELIARAAFVEKMVLIKNESFAQYQNNACTNNRLDDEDESDTSDEDDAGEREGLVSESTSPENPEDVGKSACSSIGGILVSDLDELISLLNECLQDSISTDEVDFKQPTPCSKLKRKLTVVEKLLVEKKNSSHCLIPKSCSGDVCNRDYKRDAFGICRKIIPFARLIKHPKTGATKKSLNF